MEKLDVILVTLHDQIDSDRFNLINLLGEIEALYPNGPLPEYARLLYLNYIYFPTLLSNTYILLIKSIV